ncbi:MAG TPA: CinA family nicotinamide mononucleotide deamidase-related protein [Thermodesulfobacteriota bacterium]|nr:CinA family nicotinamide mononucleotide deamidase-related protein [Thermodesulfobacteriota bacterium]
MKAEIIAVGTELLLGQIVDTNSSYIAQQLTTIGLDLHFKSTVGDNLERIKATLAAALQRSDCVITTGGIGPTLDDLTREAVAEILNRPLVFQPRLFDQIQDFFTRLGRTTSENNRKQAFIPEGAIPIENPVGTAPGFIAEAGGKAVISVPGVPHEMRYFMEHSVMPYLREKMGVREVIVSRVLKLFGIGESLVDERIKDLIESGSNPTIGLLAHTQIGEIHIRLTAKAADAQAASVLNAPVEAEIRNRLGEFIFGTDEESYEGLLAALLKESKLTLAVVETSFGSSIIQALKGMEGAERFFRLGVTVLNPAAAEETLGIPSQSFAAGGLFGADAVRLLAEAVRTVSGADLGLALTGRAGKVKGQDHLVHIALAHKEGADVVEQRWPMAMRFIENRMTKMALQQVRKKLLQAPKMS